jgi:hypothetical protein
MTVNRRNALLMSAAAVVGASILNPHTAIAQTGVVSSPYGLPISSEFPFTKQTANVLDSTMTYVARARGRSFCFCMEIRRPAICGGMSFQNYRVKGG